MSTLVQHPDLNQVKRTVRALIGTSWAEDIVILGTDVATVSDEHAEGTPYVDLGATSDIACYQAMISIADHALNPIEEWESGWIEHDPAVGQPRYTLRVWDPVDRAREPA